jgi:hypothetical protein
VRESTGTKIDVVARRMLRAREASRAVLWEQAVVIDHGPVTSGSTSRSAWPIRTSLAQRDGSDIGTAHAAIRHRWRIGSEVLPLQWRQVDLRVGEVRLDPGTTKNREGRAMKLSGQKTRQRF